MRNRSNRLRGPHLGRGLRPRAFALTVLIGLPGFAAGACRAVPDHEPDEVLRSELGLSAEDRVHRVRITGGPEERAEPAVVSAPPGAYVEFVTTDWLIHEVVFDADSLSAGQWAFLERTDQVSSPPLLDREARYVLHFEGAPLGRYPYVLEGNGSPGRGVIVIAEPEPR